MTIDRMLTEIERQQKYLDALPSDFDFPLFNSRRALESQRNNGYRTTAAAAREIVDNAIEAGASRMHVVFETTREDGEKAQVRSVAFIDDGPGMLPSMARFALSWGGGTHFDDPSFIGKFGFGLPNASINQTRRVEVYTRTKVGEPFTYAWLDITEFSQNGVQQIPEPRTAQLPSFVQRHLAKHGIDLQHGTVVVWVNADRLTYRRPSRLKEELVDDFGVVYRYILESDEHPFDLWVEGVDVEPVDPLFLMKKGKYYLLEAEGGAQKMEDLFIPVRYVFDRTAQEYHLKLAKDGEPDEQDAVVAQGRMRLRIVRFPVGFAVGGKKAPGSPEAKRRFEYRRTRRGISFVRSNREIETVDVFPKGAKAEGAGLGVWPLLQSYAYHWGAELKFDPDLDEVFGITNDKQSIRPSEDFWRVLHELDVDALLRRENNWQVDQREKEVAPVEVSSEPSPAELAAADADAAEGVRPGQVPEADIPAARRALETEAGSRATVSGNPVEDEIQAIVEEARRRPYRIAYYDSEDGPFFKPEWLGTQITVYINRKHRFFEVLYGELVRSGNFRAKQAVDLLLIALAKAELTCGTPDMVMFYATQRKHRWSPFLDVAMQSLKQRLPEVEEESVTGNQQ